MGLQGSVRSHKPLSGRPKRGATGSILRVRVGSAEASRFSGKRASCASRRLG